MREFAGKHYWLVGASEGLGRALAIKLSRAGARVTVSARSEDRLKELCEILPGASDYVVLDVASAQSVQDAAEKIGQVDGVIYLAGLYWPMKSQDWDVDKAVAMCDVNFTGAVRVLGHVVPKMVASGTGHIVLTGSLSGFRGLSGTVGYGASKAGIMYLAEGLYADLRDTGVDVQLVNPGFIKTRLTEKNDFAMPFIMEPDAAADAMFDHMQGDSFKKSFPWLFSLLFRFSQFWPDWLYFRLLGSR